MGWYKGTDGHIHSSMLQCAPHSTTPHCTAPHPPHHRRRRKQRAASDDDDIDDDDDDDCEPARQCLLPLPTSLLGWLGSLTWHSLCFHRALPPPCPPSASITVPCPLSGPPPPHTHTTPPAPFGAVDDYWSEDEEEEVESPIDAVDPFVFFAETLQGIQAAEPQRFAALMGGLGADVQAAVQGMMGYAQQLRSEAAARAAADAASAAAAAANGGLVPSKK